MSLPSDITAKLIKALQILVRLLNKAHGIIFVDALNCLNKDFIYDLLSLCIGFFNVATERMLEKEA